MNRICQIAILIFVAATFWVKNSLVEAGIADGEVAPGGYLPHAPVNSPLINTNINLVGADPAASELRTYNDVVDPKTLVDRAALKRGIDDDIEEDFDDRFITTSSGKIRPKFQPTLPDENWAEESPVSKRTLRTKRSVTNDDSSKKTVGKILSRVKRCGGGGGDDDGDANRSRRSRRSRRARRRRAEKKKAKKAAKTTTTVTRKVIQNGQVISQTVDGQSQVVQSCNQQVVPAQQQPVIVQYQQHPVPNVQTVSHQVPAAPGVVQAQPVSQQVVQPPQPQVVQPQIVQQPATATAQGSVKVNV